MSVDQVTAAGVFRVGEVLGGAWRIFTGHILFFLGVPALIYGAIVGTFAASVRLVGMAGDNQRLAWASAVLAALVGLGLYAIGQAAVVIGGLQRLGGEPLRVGAALRTSLARALPLVLLFILSTLGLGICLVVAFLILPFGLWQTGGGMLLGYVSVPIALVPAVFLFVVWAVVVPACVIDGLGPIASMFRSFDLTKGHRWKIFGIMLLAGLLFAVGKVMELMADVTSPTLAAVLSAAWVVIMMALWNCTIIMTYHDLRVAKEGIDTRQAAAVFD
jgi:hypothetical protein